MPEENDFQRRSAADAVALVLHGCAARRTSFWAWDAAAWAEVLGPSRKVFQGRYPGWADSSARTYAIALAYVFGFTELNLLGNVGRAAVARKVFGSARVGDAVGQVTSVLHGWGHRSPQVTVRTESLVCHALLLNRSPLLADLSAEVLQDLRSNTAVPYSLRQNVHSLHRALAALGLTSSPPPPARLACPPVEGVASAWAGWVQRWHDTSPLPPRGRKGRRNQMLRMGRWLAAEHPEVQEPGQWTRELCAAWVAAVDRLRIGDYIQAGDSLQERIGEPLMPRTKVGLLAGARQFFRDCQEWGWIPRPVAAEPLMPQERIRHGHDLQIPVQHRPVPLPGRQPHRKRPHPLIPPVPCLATCTSTSHEHHTHGEPPCDRRKHPARATSCNGPGTPGKGLRRTETAKLDLADWGRNPAAPEFGRFGMLHVRYGKAKRGQPPRRRNVASVMGWAVDAVADYVENIRPRFGCAGHPALWVTERGGRIKPAEINSRFEAYRDAMKLPKALSPHSLRHSHMSRI